MRLEQILCKIRDAFSSVRQPLVSLDFRLAELLKEVLYVPKQRRIAFLIIRSEVYLHIRHVGNLCQNFDIRFGEDIKILNANERDTWERGRHQLRFELRGEEKVHPLFIYPPRVEFLLIVIIEIGKRG